MGNADNNKRAEPYLYSRDSIITDVNKEFTDFTGFTRDELLGKSLIGIGNMLKINSQILLDNIKTKYSKYIFTKYIEAREINISLFHGKETNYIFTKCLEVREVSISLFHGKETNEKRYAFIEKPNSRLDDKLMAGVDVYSVPDLILLKANQKHLDFMDSPFNKKENSIGKPIAEIVAGFIGSQSEVIFNSILETQKDSHIKEFKYDKLARGITYWDISKIPIFENGKMKYIFQTFSEVTERVLKNQNLERQNKIIQQQKEQLEKQLEKQLEEKNIQYEFMNRMIDTFDLPVVRLSCPDLKIVDINKNACSIARLLRPDITSIMQIKGNKIEDLFKIFKTREYYRSINEVLKEKKTKYLNKKSHWVNGMEVYWNVIFEPLLDINGEIKEILILAIDVTNEIHSNIVMEKALKSQADLLANISHELKTPLNVIFATAQLFSMYCDSGSLDENKDSIIKYIDSIKQNSYRLSKLINNIVDSSKIEAGYFQLNLSNNNIVEVVEEIVTSVTNFTESKGLNIIFDTDIEEKIIACDPEKVERIVLNLISNAIKFSNKGDEIFIAVNDRNEFVQISVKDNGIGIEDKDLDMIFHRFKQVDKSLSRNSEGTGIGLNLVKSIVELHGGSIYVESELGKGSKFTVMIPSKKVLQENMLLSSKIRNINESIKVEFSDVYS